jgi:ribosomal protein S18 acetylase RimI-like enzyme
MTKDIIIREARVTDAEGVLRLLEQIAAFHHEGRPDIFKANSRKYSKEEFEDILKDEKRPVFVAVDAENIVRGYAFCMVMEQKEQGPFHAYPLLYIDDVCVDKAVRRKSIGRKLFETVKMYAQDTGLRNIELNVWEFNDGAIKFYEKCGFTSQRRRMELLL